MGRISSILAEYNLIVSNYLIILFGYSILWIWPGAFYHFFFLFRGDSIKFLRAGKHQVWTLVYILKILYFNKKSWHCIDMVSMLFWKPSLGDLITIYVIPKSYLKSLTNSKVFDTFECGLSPILLVINLSIINI